MALGVNLESGFNKIIKQLREAHVSTHYDPKVLVVLPTDASEYGLETVVHHKMSDDKRQLTHHVLSKKKEILRKQRRRL